MERRPAPEVTIEGGAGWQLDTAREAVDAEPAPSGVGSGRRRVGGLLLAAALGFGAATALAEVRTTTLAESDDGVLSLEVRLEQVDYGGTTVADAEGRPALTTTVVLRNTGPRAVAVERAELVGTPYATDDLAGRRVAEGGQVVLTLLRPVDCGALRRTGPVGPLRVTATTGAGPRTVDLRMDTEVVGFHDDQTQGACGQNPADRALTVDEQRESVDGTRYEVALELANASARPLLLTGSSVLAGLRLVEVLGEQRVPVDLPLDLPPGDYDPPVDAFQGRGPERTVVFVLEVADCSRLRPPSPEQFDPVLDLRVSDLEGRSGTFGIGFDGSSVQQLRDAACPQQPGTVVRSSLAGASEAAQRGHPFLTPY